MMLQNSISLEYTLVINSLDFQNFLCDFSKSMSVDCQSGCQLKTANVFCHLKLIKSPKLNYLMQEPNDIKLAQRYQDFVQHPSVAYQKQVIV